MADSIVYGRDISRLFVFIYASFGIMAFLERIYPLNYNKYVKKEVLFGFIYAGYAIGFWYLSVLYGLIGFSWWILAAVFYISAWSYRMQDNHIHILEDY